MKIETFYYNCDEPFFFKLKLYKHLCEKYIKNFSATKFNLIDIKLLINFKKSKSHFVVVEISRIMKFIVFIFDQDFKFDFKS